MEWGLFLLWGGIFQLLMLLGAPITAKLFPTFPDRGIALGLPLALVIITSISFWIGHFTFGPPALIVGLLGLLLVTVIALVWGTMPVFQWRPVLDVSIVFALAFGFMIAVRAVDPSITPYGGESFLDFGILKSLLRADRLPPEDMWYAGEPIRYYYGGHLIAALLAKLTGTSANYSYNLALAGFYAMLVTAAFGVAQAIADAQSVPSRMAGLFTAFFVGFASNLHTPAGVALLLLPDALAAQIIDLSGVKSNIIPTLYPFDTGPATRVIGETINEFPLFGFLHGDLHAYLTSTPFLILLIALLFAYHGTLAIARRRRWLLLGITVPVIGLLPVIDTWSFPTACGVVFLTVFFAPAHPLSLLPHRVQAIARQTLSDGGRESRFDTVSRLAVAVVLTMMLGLGGLIWASPFIIGTASSRPIGVLPDRSLFSEFILVQGAFLLVFALYFLPRIKPHLPVEENRRLVVLFALLVGVGLLTNVSVLLVVGPLLAVAILLQWKMDDLGYEGILFISGAGLVLLVEFVYIQDGAAPGRVNTVFKIYFQTWIIWSLAIGVVLAKFIAPVMLWQHPWGRLPMREKIVPVGIATLLISLSLYGGLALGTHFTNDSRLTQSDGPTLDALAFVEEEHPDEAAAIAWVNRRPGHPTIVEAPGVERYRWVNPASTLTGIPTVAGWAHEIGYRDPEEYIVRTLEVKFIYTGEPEVRERLLDKYDVTYIYVGPEEQQRYDITPFADLPSISTIYQDDHVTIYKVDQDSLDGTRNNPAENPVLSILE